jgi:hypothetical protein
MRGGGCGVGPSAFRAGPLTASMPTLQMSQPVVAAVLGVVVLGETLDTGGAGAIALVAPALVMTAAIIKLARVEAVATRNRVKAKLRDSVSQPAWLPPGTPLNEFIAIATLNRADRLMWRRERPETHYTACTVSGQR